MGVANQGESKKEALNNLREALEPHFEPPAPTKERSYEDVLTMFQCKVDFHEVVNDPTMDEWPQV